MSANRKLLGEIQQVMKKIDEGVEIFDEIWDKVYAADNQTLKEKYEADLKKEIKKLQRLRDQIKTWISGGDIKDKTQLLEARRTIESKMEQFKVCEKDTKTKAYSKEGLAREAKMDPRELAREEKRAWINECIEQLQDLINTVELEKEKLLAAKNKKSSKEGLEKCDNRISKHKWHIGRLELIIKLLDHDELDPMALDSIKDSLDYYIESAADDDGAVGVDAEFDIYEDLGLEALGEMSFDLPPRHHDDDPAAAPTPAAGPAVPAVANIVTATGKINVKNPPAPAASPTPSAPAPVAANAAPKEAAKPAKGPAPAAKGTKGTKDTVSTSEDEPSTPKEVAAPKGPKQPAQVSPKPSAAAIVAGTASTNAAAVPTPVVAALSPPPALQQQKAAPAAMPRPSPAAAAAPLAPPPSLPAPTPAPSAPVAAAATVTPSPKVPAKNPTPVAAQPLPPAAAAVMTPPPALPPALPAPSAPSTSSVVTSDSDDMNSLAQSISSQMALGQQEGRPAPNASANAAPMLTGELAAVYAQLKSSLSFLDEEKVAYAPRNRYNYAHPSFPSQPLFSTPPETGALFDKLHLDTQFFCFYFQQGSYQQYLASRKLKKSSWRFHKKYATWFQRHTEPKIATDDFEEGTYVYFDYESGWCQRIKSEFKFEYAFLEDEVAI